MSGSSLGAASRLVALALLAACARPEDGPEPPDVSHLLSAYAEPRGIVDPAAPLAWLDGALAQLELLGGGQAHVVMTGIVEAASERVEETSLPSGKGGLVPTRLDGIATFEVQCGDTAEESASVAVAIVDGVVSALLWGTARACPLWERGRHRAAYDGSFAVHRYGGGDVLVRVDGTMTGSASPIKLDFRLAADRLETRVPSPSGDLIASREGANVVVRAANGKFRCGAKARTCRLDPP